MLNVFRSKLWNLEWTMVSETQLPGETSATGVVPRLGLVGALGYLISSFNLALLLYQIQSSGRYSLTRGIGT